MKYQKIKPNSYSWVSWLHICWILVTFLLITFYIMSKSAITLAILVLMTIISILYIVFPLKNIKNARTIARSLHRHICENELCKVETKNQRDYFVYYPKGHWKLDRSTNILHIRFRLTGNKINLHNLEQKLSERLERECINVYETRRYIEYQFKDKAEERLNAVSLANANNKLKDTQLMLSPSFTWDYILSPHFLISGSSGVGKSTLARFLMSHLIQTGVHITFIDIKRDREMEKYCKDNPMITYAYETEAIVDAVRNIAYEMQRRKEEIDKIGNSTDFDYQFSPLFLICDEIVLLKLLLPPKIYEEIFNHITSIIVAGREKKIFAGLITQLPQVEYLGSSTLRASIGLKISLGHATPREISMIFGDDYSDVKNLRYEIGSGLIMRKNIDSRPREFIAPLIE